MVKKKQKTIEFNFKPTENPVHRGGDSFALAWAYYWHSDKEEIDCSKAINEKKNRLETKEVSYRIINHWEDQGLITCDRPSNKSWRQYSFMDLVWFQIIVELRNFGLPLDGIRKAKKSLEWLKEKFSYSEFPLLEFHTVHALLNRLPAYLLVFSNGDSEPLSANSYIASTKLYNLNSHIRINLNSILQRLLPDKDLSPQFEKTIEVSSEEFDLLFMIRMQNYESITIKTNSGTIERLEASKSEKQDSRIIDLINSGDYQNIEIIQRDKKIVHIKKTIQINYKKNGK